MEHLSAGTEVKVFGTWAGTIERTYTTPGAYDVRMATGESWFLLDTEFEVVSEQTQQQ